MNEKRKRLAELDAMIAEQDRKAEQNEERHLEEFRDSRARLGLEIRFRELFDEAVERQAEEEGTETKATVIAYAVSKLYEELDGLGILDHVDEDDELETSFQFGGGWVIASITVDDLTYGIDHRTMAITRQREAKGRIEYSVLRPDREWGPWTGIAPPSSRAASN